MVKIDEGAGRNAGQRYIYRTDGVCPPEIHFRIDHDRLTDLRFVGGGCPGNAALVSRLLEGRTLGEAAADLRGIDCRNATSCPDQLARALEAAAEGALEPAGSFRLQDLGGPLTRVGLVGHPEGDARALEAVWSAAEKEGIEALICLGNLAGGKGPGPDLIKILRRREAAAAGGDRDWRLATGGNGLSDKEKDFLLRLPQVISFDLGGRPAVVFYGEYIQDLEGFSDYDPYSLEMNMVCSLADFLADESVFPALEAMVPQFAARVVVFGQPGTWGIWNVGGVDFIGVGRVHDPEGGYSWAVLEAGMPAGLRIMNTDLKGED